MTIRSSASRRRARSLALKASALALGLAFTGAGHALAQVGSFTDAITVVNEPRAGNPGFFTDAKSKTQTTAGGSSVQVNTPRFGELSDGTFINSTSVAVAKAFQPGQLLFVSQGGDVFVNPVQGTASVFNFASASMTDTLTVLGVDPLDHQDITLHKVLQLTEGLNLVSGFTGSGGPPVGNVSTQLSISSEGIGPGPLGGNVFESQTLDANGISVAHPPQFIDFALHMQLNDAHTFSITMADFASGSLNNVNGTASGFLSFLEQDTLNFTSGVSITDAAGNAMCGLHISAASGRNFGAINACAPTGGGGGDAGGVPEPASWALMIAGFGGVGAALRRQRRLAIAA